MWCWIKSSFVDLDGWENGWFWFGWSEFLRGDYLQMKNLLKQSINLTLPALLVLLLGIPPKQPQVSKPPH
ncbi:hypothetical protein [uncultured Gammaproteobacteria bacterium]|nr:hypothetical protein [uncultured Gammaproteobacteria bacterium]